jgi:predicted N-acetyltransferase YhbS
MVALERARWAAPEEFSDVMRFVDMVFRPNEKGRYILQRQYPHAYRHHPAYSRRLLVLRDQDEIIGALAVHPQRFRLASGSLDAGGIGVVGTHPQRRGQGIMGHLLHQAVEHMQDQGMALSVLGGDRQRYGWFGWENAGCLNRFNLTARQAGPLSAADKELEIARLGADSDWLSRWRRWHKSLPYGLERPQGESADLFVRRGREVWGAVKGRRFAYLVLRGAGRNARPFTRIDEAGGDTEMVQGLIRRIFARFRLKNLVANTGPNIAENTLIEPLSQSWQRGACCMAKIIDLPALVAGLKPLLLERNAGRQAGVIRLVMPDATGGQQEAVLDLGGPKVELCLDQRQMVQFFFGSFELSERFKAPLAALSGTLPLPLYLPPLSAI